MAKDKSGSDGTTTDSAPISLIIKDPEKFAQNIAKMIEGMTRAANAFLKPREDGKLSADLTDEIAEIVRTLAKVIEYWTAEPGRSIQAQSKL